MTALFLAVLLGGCSILPGLGSRLSPDATFPHPDDYARGVSHGKEALDLGRGRCEVCHDGSNPEAATCVSCHPSYPHESGWQGEKHGGSLMTASVTKPAAKTLEEPTAPMAMRCSICHGNPDLMAGRDNTCSSCHPVYPHPPSWMISGQHGREALGRGDMNAACGTCHLDDTPGATIPETYCRSCHPTWPHGETWADPSEHGASVVTAKSTADCDVCHGALGAGGSSRIACAQCHLDYPHPEDWGIAHLGATLATGEIGCMACHEKGEGPPTMVATCSPLCHGGGK